MPSSIPTPLPSVQPGDLITAELINKLIRRLDVLQGAVSETNFLLGPLAKDTHTVVALGTGFEDGGGIWVDGVPQLDGAVRRGIHLVVLDPRLQLKFRGHYDTYNGADAATRLAQEISINTARGDVVLGVTHDSYVEGLSGDATPAVSARAALASIGAASLGADPKTSRVTGHTQRVRDNAAFIGVAPANKAGVSFDYLVSVMPADGVGTESGEQLAALPFAWGIYSIPLKRFIIGGSSATPPFPNFVLPTPIPAAVLPSRTGGFAVKPDDPVSVLPGIGRNERGKLLAAGVTNVKTLLGHPPDKLEKLLGLKPADVNTLLANTKALLGRG